MPHGSVDAKKVTLYLSNVKALKEKTLPLRNPSLTMEKTITFPVELQPEQYLILKPEEDVCKVYSANGFPLEEVKSEGEISIIKRGNNKVAFGCDTSQGLSQIAKVKLSLLEE